MSERLTAPCCATCRHWYGQGVSDGTGAFDSQCLRRVSGASGSFFITSSSDWCDQHEPAGRRALQGDGE